MIILLIVSGTTLNSEVSHPKPYNLEVLPRSQLRVYWKETRTITVGDNNYYGGNVSQSKCVLIRVKDGSVRQL